MTGHYEVGKVELVAGDDGLVEEVHGDGDEAVEDGHEEAPQVLILDAGRAQSWKNADRISLFHGISTAISSCI